MIVLIDNYDSFSYNVYQLIGSVEPDIKVVRNDEVTIKELEAMLGVLLFQRSAQGSKAKGFIVGTGKAHRCGLSIGRHK